MQEKHLKKSNEFVNKEIFIYRAKKEKNTEKIQLGNKKSIKNKILIKPKVQSSKAKKSNKKINISNNSTSKNSVLNNSKKKNTTKQKSKMKGNPIKKRAIKNAIIRNKINSKNKLIEKNKIGIKENLKNFIDEEINGLAYIIAVKIDKRSFCQYYESLLKTKHILICTFFNNSDYNLGIIKMDLFFVSFVIEYTINALFYNDDTMHEIYKSKGQFDLETQLPIIVYSTIISYLLNLPLGILALSNDSIINFKQSKIKNNIMKRAKKLVNILNFKFVIYFIKLFIIIIFPFCNIFISGSCKNTCINL